MNTAVAPAAPPRGAPAAVPASKSPPVWAEKRHATKSNGAVGEGQMFPLELRPLSMFASPRSVPKKTATAASISRDGIQRGDGLGISRHQVGHVSAARAEVERVGGRAPRGRSPRERRKVLPLRVDRALDISFGSRTELILRRVFMSFRTVSSRNSLRQKCLRSLLQAEIYPIISLACWTPIKDGCSAISCARIASVWPAKRLRASAHAGDAP